MNYLSHYYIDNKPGNFYFNSALFIPDFARNYAKNFDREVFGLNTNQMELQLGCLAHLKADKVFHPSTFFIKYSQIINKELQQFEPLAHLNRKWFLAHILFEMLIDRLLVKFFPITCEIFYYDLNKIDTKTLHDFVLCFSNKNIEPFMKNFSHFCKVKYLFGYAFDDSFVYSLARVYKQATAIEMSMSDRFALKIFINKLEQQYFYSPMIILAELKQVFGINSKL